jgi:hypothetical protein
MADEKQNPQQGSGQQSQKQNPQQSGQQQDRQDNPREQQKGQRDSEHGSQGRTQEQVDPLTDRKAS